MTEKAKGESKRKYTTRLFPKNSLLDALKLADSIYKNNAGRPYNRLDLAKSLGYTPDSGTFRTLITSSGRFGLTQGGYVAEKISLLDLGKNIVAPRNPEEKSESLLKALFKIDLYKKFFTQFNNHKLPKKEFLTNTLHKDFGIPIEDVDECYEMIIKNAKELNLITLIKDGEYIKLENLFSGELEEVEEPEGEEEEEEGEEPEEEPEEPSKPEKKQIFIAHGKNHVPLDQLKAILTKFKIPHLVAEDEPHAGRPISKKVSDYMHQCSSAILIFTADETYTDAEGKLVKKPSDNVVYELGASSVLYENRIVIFKEEEVTFGSDFRDLGYISFEKDKLDAKTTELLVELIALGSVAIQTI